VRRNHGFGKDLTEAGARWLIDVIQAHIDATGMHAPPAPTGS
jgi:hypothetical protein